MNEARLLAAPLGAAFAAAIVLVTTPSHAQRSEWSVGVDVAAILPFSEKETNVGWMTGAHVGRSFAVGVVDLGPEIGGNYGVVTPEANARKSIGGGYLGIRVALPEVPIIVPYGYFHFGYGVADARNLPDPNDTERFASGAWLDLTFGVRRRLTPFFDVGVEGGYASVEPGRCFCARWAHLGAAGTFVF